MRVLADGLDFPEGPAFDSNGVLWCTEAFGGNLVRWERDGTYERVDVGGIPNALAVDADDNLLICDFEYDAVRRYDPTADTIETVMDGIDGEPLDKPNDLAFDAEGNLVFTCSGDPEEDPEAPTQYVCSYQPDGTINKIAEELVFPNGLTFYPPGELVVAETYEHRLLKGRWDPETCRWTDVSPWAEVGGPIGPDGMTVDAEGRIVVAVFGESAIKAVDRGGSVVEEWDLPGANPTNVAFDPEGELGGVVTEVERGEMLSLTELGVASDTIPYVG